MSSLQVPAAPNVGKGCHGGKSRGADNGRDTEVLRRRGGGNKEAFANFLPRILQRKMWKPRAPGTN